LSVSEMQVDARGLPPYHEGAAVRLLDPPETTWPLHGWTPLPAPRVVLAPTEAHSMPSRAPPGKSGTDYTRNFHVFYRIECLEIRCASFDVAHG
jgi:hypothetical protein